MTQSLEVGWNPDLDLPSAVALLPADRLADTFVLISVIDSSRPVGELTSVVPFLAAAHHWHEVISGDVVVRAPTLAGLVDIGLFNGFDEIWLYSEIPREPRDHPRIGSDRSVDEIEREVAAGVSTKCWAGLGDGDGLNFITRDAHAAKQWRSWRA